MNATLLMASPDGQGGSSFSLIMMGAIILVFWLFMIRPQAKKAKEQKRRQTLLIALPPKTHLQTKTNLS